MAYTTKFTVKEVCDILGVEVPEEYKNIENDVLTNLASQLKYVKEGGGYFPLANSRENRQFKFDRAVADNVKVVFVGKAGKYIEGLDKVPHIYVNSLQAVSKISGHIREQLGIQVVGITGSLGKTTTKDIIFHVLRQKFLAERSYGNGNTLHPMFDHLQQMRKGTEMFIQEFGVASKGYIEKQLNACMPNVAVITNISDPHLDVFGTRENILEEKKKVVNMMPEGCPAFLNYDDELLRKVEFDKHPIISYAIKNHDADYYAENIVKEDDCMTFDVVHGDERISLKLYAFGEYNVINAVCAVAVAKWYGLTDKQIIDGVADYTPLGIRQNLINIGGYHIYLDCYNTAPVSLVGAMKVLSQFKVENNGKRVAVIADIARLGDQAPELHEKTGREISEIKGIDLVLCFGNENAKILADAIGGKGIKTMYTPDRNQLDQWMRENINREDITLVKGPVPRLLSKSVDQVFGSAYHLSSEHCVEYTEGDYRLKVVREKEDATKTTLGVMKYNGSDKSIKLPDEYKGAKSFAVGTKCCFGNSTIEEVIIPEPIYNIGLRAFGSCSSLKKVVLPKTLKVIERGAFSKCSALEEITLPEGIIDIGMNAFRGCKNLKTLHLPESIGQIGPNAFKGCGKVNITTVPGSYAEKYMEQSGKVISNIKNTYNDASKKKNFFSRVKRYIKRTIKG